MSDTIDAKLVCAALRAAVWQRKPAAGLLVHTDRGSQYGKPRVPAADQAVGCHDVNEQKGQRLGQRADGELLQDPEG